MTRSLYGRIALAFAAIMLFFGAVIAWLSHTAARYHQQEVIQRLSWGLAEHIAGHWPLTETRGLDHKAIDELFHMLMVVNPSIEVYLLDEVGAIQAHLAPPGHLKRRQVALDPILAFLRGAPAPIIGDDPRSLDGRKIFSAASLQRDHRTIGYLYIVLAGEDYQALAHHLWQGHVFRSAALAAGIALLLTLLAGLCLFAWITRRLKALTGTVRELQAQDFTAPLNFPAREAERRDEIGQLAYAFHQMAKRIQAQVGELKRQDQLRRELIANVSHDLRTPLTSLQGYLETLERKADNLPLAERQRYLDVAVRQSQKVARLSQELFELAKLECEDRQPVFEIFPLGELIQDVVQKFELAATRQNISLTAHLGADIPPVRADIGMIERVLTNLLDNALRHTPEGGQVRLELMRCAGGVNVTVQDTGCGIAPDRLAHLLQRRSPLSRSTSQTSGGLGLLIARRILDLHGSRISLKSAIGKGTLFEFALPTALPALSGAGEIDTGNTPQKGRSLPAEESSPTHS